MGMTPEKYNKIRELVDKIVDANPKPSQAELIKKFGTECYGTFSEKDAIRQAKKFLKTVYGKIEYLIEVGTDVALEKKANSGSGKLSMRVVRLQNPIEGFQEKIGDYLLGEQIGEGATSKVYLGKNLTSKKLCALKILKVDEKFNVQNLQKEIKVLKSLKHKHVNGLIDCFENVIYPDIVKKGTTTVMVLELSSRGELYDYIHATGAFEPDLARWCFKGMMEGLKYCHDMSVVHRDLKPENVLLDNDYIVKLVDFGFSRFFDDDKGLMTTRLGTPGYVAPEILKAKKYTKSVDIFTMGVILFSLYSGFPPFREQKKTDWWWDKLSKKNYSLFWKAHEQAKKYEDDFKDLVNRMITFDPKERITSEKILAHKWMQKETCSQEEAASRLAKRKIEVDKKHAEKAKKATVGRQKTKRALGELDPPVLHGFLPFDHFFTSHLAKDVEETVKEHVENKLQGDTCQMKCGLWVGDKVDEINADGSKTTDEEKRQDDKVPGQEWTDLKFTVKFQAGEAPKQDEAKDSDESLPKMGAQEYTFEGLCCVRQHPTMKDEHNEKLNVAYFKQLGENRQRAPRDVWRKLVDELMSTRVCALKWTKPSKEQIEAANKKNLDALGVVDDLGVTGGCLPSCGPS